jgi:hypothetical protein
MQQQEKTRLVDSSCECRRLSLRRENIPQCWQEKETMGVPMSQPMPVRPHRLMIFVIAPTR